MKIKKCRICGNNKFLEVLSLGNLAFTGIFPSNMDEEVPKGDLTLWKCETASYESELTCGLVQLAEEYDPRLFFGNGYGYQSRLNVSMVNHLSRVVDWVSSKVLLNQNDLILDIGSNDGTLLNFLTNKDLSLIGMDPSSAQFAKYYNETIRRSNDFFSAEGFTKISNGKKAKIIFSIAMFYDLVDPNSFVKDIVKILNQDGFWYLEQSYLPLMMKNNAIDSICHEHLEYYDFDSLRWLFRSHNLYLHDFQINEVNGGSIGLLVSKKPFAEEIWDKLRLITLEITEYRGFEEALKAFAINSQNELEKLRLFILKETKAGKRFAALGASTKGNVLLQYANLSSNLISVIGEINPSKFGKFTPGTRIPIVNENEAIADNFDYYIVLPWHFKTTFIQRLGRSVNLVFPLPYFDLVRRTNT